MTSDQEHQAIATLDALGMDVEEAHVKADQALIAFLDATHPEVSAAWRRVQDRYDGFGFRE